MDVRIPPLQTKIVPESNPLKSTVFVEARSSMIWGFGCNFTNYY